MQELKKLLQSTGIGGIRALFTLPVEYRGTRFYSQRHGLPLHCLDSSLYSRQLLSHVDELLAPENLKKVATFETTPLKESVREEYKLVEYLLRDRRHFP